jgi:hypothetical protein
MRLADLMIDARSSTASDVILKGLRNARKAGTRYSGSRTATTAQR